MKLTKTASGKTKVKMSREEWTRLGQKAGWLSKSANQQFEQKQNNEKAYELRDQLLSWVSAFRWESTNLGSGDEDTKKKKYRVWQSLSYGINNAPDMNSKIAAVNSAATGFFELGYREEGEVCQKIAQGMMGKNIQNVSWSPPQPKQEQQQSTSDWMAQNGKSPAQTDKSNISVDDL